MMFDEEFMLLVSDIANKSSEPMFARDFRDPLINGKLLHLQVPLLFLLSLYIPAF